LQERRNRWIEAIKAAKWCSCNDEDDGGEDHPREGCEEGRHGARATPACDWRIDLALQCRRASESGEPDAKKDEAGDGEWSAGTKDPCKGKPEPECARHKTEELQRGRRTSVDLEQAGALFLLTHANYGVGESVRSASAWSTTCSAAMRSP
jgi:hypothetical protein